MQKSYHNSINYCSVNFKASVKMRILEFHEKLNVSLGLCSHKNNVRLLKKLRHIFTCLIFFVTYSYVISYSSAEYIVKNMKNYEEINMAVFQFFAGTSTSLSMMFFFLNRNNARKIIDGFQNIVDKRKYQNDLC